ncbi:MAG TPA: hypothetical protein VFW59_07415 [Gallionella sp.]|nr:hypothetical protein [Gallionella sp.]
MNDNDHMHPSETPFRGLAPFLRLSIAGADLQPVAQQLLALAQDNGDDANLWMNLSLAMQCLGQRDLGMAMQQQALALKRIYHIAATIQPARFRLLMLMVPGDLSANTPLECLLEDGDIDLDCYYVTPGDPLAQPLPEHDAVIVAIGESDDNHPTLEALELALAHWPKPVINAPLYIRTTERAVASALLQDVPGLVIPPTLHASRPVLLEIAAGESSLPELSGGCDFPIILRPVGSQAGRDLDRITDPAGIALDLARVNAEDFFLSPFIDYSGTDGQFRKFRVALIDGVPYACHMGVSSHWMVHYVNAGMYEDAHKREEEAAFMANFDDFAQRHHEALKAIHERTGLDYLCIDCAETQDGQLLIFEVDHVMVVHAMDPEELFPYKQFHMRKVRDAFRDFLFRRAAEFAATKPS